ncbi:vitamin K-dependent gamma-carboxylase-like [Babylonia areolata]|uniref:vitamin K-dependent gamma-carboxylase-like n=1 Tax=Babylonia areolata TaxID=304850 RepID=UPI003FD04C1D
MDRPVKKRSVKDTGSRSTNTTAAGSAKQSNTKHDHNKPRPHKGILGLAASSEDEDQCKKKDEDRFYQLFGFNTSDLRSWNRFVRLLSRPTDPACLAYVRFSFGLLMLVDIFEERGLSQADARWGNEEECRFPLFDFLQPLPLHLMVLLYLLMVIGTVGVMLGLLFRVSCLLHLLPYWYILLLEKSRWNNHSYLFGIMAFLLLISDANRYWSFDGLFSTTIRNADVPLWNYTLLRTQLFLVYFLAGLKKLDMDWISGYSMTYLSDHWVFYPFKLVMTESQVDLIVVHLGGLIIDLSVGFLLFFDKTRPLGILISFSFNSMNSRLFAIGMFPYAMMALTPLFFYTTWPKAVFRCIPRSLRVVTPDDDDDDTQPSLHCLYTKEQAKSELLLSCGSSEVPHRQPAPPTQPSFRHHAAAVFTIVFIVWQLFLPHSHFITKGYNSWTQGLYGYSWDMMVHSRKSQHTRITFVDKDTGQTGYLDPEVWTKTTRWAHNPEMIKQYARCIAHHLHKHNIHNVELYFDIWISLNKRFQQRIVDPHVDMVQAEWSAFSPTPWVMPLLVDLSDWRTRLLHIEDQLFNSSHHYEVVFVADFPGMYLENYVSPGIGNFTMSVLQGQVVVEVMGDEDSHSHPYNISVHQGQDVQIPTGVFHNVHTVSEQASCYMYMYIDTEEVTFLQNLQEFEQSLNGSLDNPVPAKFAKDPKVDQYLEVLRAKNSSSGDSQASLRDSVHTFLRHHYTVFVRGLMLIKAALWTVITGKPFQTYLKEINSQLMNATNVTST